MRVPARMMARMPMTDCSIVALIDVAPFGDDRLAHGAVRQAGARQKPRPRVDRPARIVEAERRAGLRQHDVGVVEGLDGADIGPEAAKQVRLHLVAVQRVRDDLPPEVRGLVLLEHLEENLAGEHVDADRGDERLVLHVPAERRARGNAAADVGEPRGVRLLLERDDLTVAIESEDAHPRRLVRRRPAAPRS